MTTTLPAARRAGALLPAIAKSDKRGPTWYLQSGIRRNHPIGTTTIFGTYLPARTNGGSRKHHLLPPPAPASSISTGNAGANFVGGSSFDSRGVGVFQPSPLLPWTST